MGLHAEARGFLGWVLGSIERDGDPGVLYTLDGLQPPPERADPDLEGYRRSAPVRWGNAAAGQRQHDAYGEILDCAYQWVAAGGEPDPSLWGRLSALVDEARARWDQPDHGIWEVRTSTRPFTYSAAMCQVALDRGARLAQRLGLPGDVAGWSAESQRWNREHVAGVDIVWDETVALEGRAGYYDHTGALRDVIQNHLLQLLCLVAMERPAALDAKELRDRKVELLRAVRTPAPAEVPAHTRRARYRAGRIGERQLPDYTAEPGVDPARQTETFAEVT